MRTKQNPAIARLMANRRRQLMDDGRTASVFPKWKPGMSTADYIFQYMTYRPDTLPFKLGNYDRPAPFFTGPEVVEET